MGEIWPIKKSAGCRSMLDGPVVPAAEDDLYLKALGQRVHPHDLLVGQLQPRLSITIKVPD